ncbi:MAG: GNAT family N-acetyltransferase [Crocinitomicaceae bacterium]
MLLIVSAHSFQLTENQFQRLYEIITVAYAETEKTLWGKGYVRLTEDELRQFIEQDEVYIALLKGKIVGGVRMFQLTDSIWSFSLLGADFEMKGLGIGRALIHHVEQETAQRNGKQIRIEVLRPENQTIASKEILKNWYQRQGYKIVKVIPLQELYPEKEKLLKVPAVFDCYEKML